MRWPQLQGVRCDHQSFRLRFRKNATYACHVQRRREAVSNTLTKGRVVVHVGGVTWQIDFVRIFHPIKGDEPGEL